MRSYLTRRQFVCGGAASVAAGLSLSQWSGAEGPNGPWSLENQYFKYVVGLEARSLHFIDRQSGRDYCSADGSAPLAHIKKGGRSHAATSARYDDGRLTLGFGDSGVQAVLKAIIHPQHIVLEVLSVTGEGVEELTFADIPLTLQGGPEEQLVACALALNLQTNVPNVWEFPPPPSRLRAICYARRGMVGAKVALVAVPRDNFRKAMQEAVSMAEELPHAPLCGPWALGQPINQGSYLFNFNGMTIETADDWIRLCQTLGINQINFHGGHSFRFGDFRPHPQTFPDGIKSFKAVIDKLHAAGIVAGLHTYAYYIHKECPWVTPVPDRRLAKDATFTLAADIAADAAVVPVVESTAGMSALTAEAVHNSATLHIDDELIVYTGVTQEPPFRFTGCVRGACGTRAAAHAKGARAHHFKECMGMFVPDPDSTLIEEIAVRTAEMYDACGFDMIYLDALDGCAMYGGVENGWYHDSRFVYEICRRIGKPASMGMSTFYHHFWCVCSRYGAWDHPNRSYKAFIDRHCAMNEEDRRKMLLPSQLGWWALKTWSDIQDEPTFSDDIEYLVAKCLGTDTGFSLMGIDPNSARSIPALPRLAEISRRYEELRHSGKVPESIKAQLRAPGKDFMLIGDLQQGWQFKPARYAKHRVVDADPWSSRWQTVNEFAAQPLCLRIEAYMGAGPYDAPGNATMAEFAAADEFTKRETASAITADLRPGKDVVRLGDVSGCFTATNGGRQRASAWAMLEKTFTPPRNLSSRQALGLWVHGDGQGEVLNVQLRHVEYLPKTLNDHYIVVDFAGWRYFELVEPERDPRADYQWPYVDRYDLYRERVRFDQIETLGLWYNNLPPGKPVTCHLSPIKALPLVSAKLLDPAVSINGHTVVLPGEIPSGHYLELFSAEDCKLYGPNGALVRTVKPQGAIPLLKPGSNEVHFTAQTKDGVRPRAQVTIITRGDAIVP